MATWRDDLDDLAGCCGCSECRRRRGEIVRKVEDMQRLTKDMRDAQRTYFASRTPTNLKRAKDLELKVDIALARQSELAIGS